MKALMYLEEDNNIKMHRRINNSYRTVFCSIFRRNSKNTFEKILIPKKIDHIENFFWNKK